MNLGLTSRVVHSDDVVTAQQLNKHPELSLHKAGKYVYLSEEEITDHSLAPSEPLTAYDGCVGAVVGDSHYFIITPYEVNVNNPPLGNQKMQMHTNGRYRCLDWALWPQVYHKSCCHFTCILWYDPDLPLSYMWLAPSLKHFTKETGPTVIGSLCKLFF